MFHEEVPYIQGLAHTTRNRWRNSGNSSPGLRPELVLSGDIRTGLLHYGTMEGRTGLFCVTMLGLVCRSF